MLWWRQDDGDDDDAGDDGDAADDDDHDGDDDNDDDDADEDNFQYSGCNCRCNFSTAAWNISPPHFPSFFILTSMNISSLT